jgi:hypothetical protein
VGEEKGGGKISAKKYEKRKQLRHVGYIQRQLKLRKILLENGAIVINIFVVYKFSLPPCL